MTQSAEGGRAGHKTAGAKAPGAPNILTRVSGPWSAAAVLGAFYVLMVSSVWNKSLTSDEPVYALGGCAYWRHNDYRINPENGNLPQRLAGLPLAIGDFRFPSREQPLWQTGQQWLLAVQFFYEIGNHAERMALYGRCAVALLAVALAAAVYGWSRRLFGDPGGMVSLLLCVLSPIVLANGPLMTADIAAALAFLVSVWALWGLLHCASPARLAVSCAAVGALFLSKMSAPLILPMAAIMTAARLIHPAPLIVRIGGRVREVRRRAAQAGCFLAAALIHLIAAVALVWAAYGFRYEAAADGQGPPGPFMVPWEQLLSRDTLPLKVIGWTRDRRLLPEAFLHGYGHAYYYSEGRPAFLDGQFSIRGWLSFFPKAFLYKTPLSHFALWLAAALGAVPAWRTDSEGRAPSQTECSEEHGGRDGARPSARHERRTRRALIRAVASLRGILPALYPTLPLWTLAAVYGVAAVFSRMNIGFRHVLPVHPPLFILAGAAGCWLARRRARGIVLAALALLAVEIAWRWPNYIPYFNPLAGGPANGWKRLVDSSLDWGQDLPALKAYLDKNRIGGPDGEPACLAYFGTASPIYHGIGPDRVRYLPSWPGFDRQATSYVPVHPDNMAQRFLPAYEPGVYFISATMLQPLLLRPLGPWDETKEELYQRAGADLYRLTQARRNQEANPLELLQLTTKAPPAWHRLTKGWRASDSERSRLYWDRLPQLYDSLMFQRLCRHLRERGPDGNVNHSILIFRLSEEELARAFAGPWERR